MLLYKGAGSVSDIENATPTNKTKRQGIKDHRSSAIKDNRTIWELVLPLGP